MALEETGVKFVTEDEDAFQSALDAAGDAVSGLGDIVGNVSGGIADAMGEVVVGALRKVGEVAIEALGAAAGAVKDFFTDSIGEALDAQKNIQKLESVIKSTGGAAGLTSEQAQKLATDMRDLAGGSDDAVLAIEEIGLRAGTVSADEMPAFIQTTLDLAQVTGDAASAATLLARAQEDPIAAMGKAQRAGIIFDKALQDQIKTLVKDGKTQEATALFTKRLADATGGLAADASKTLSGQWEILTGHFKEVQEVIGTALLPVLQMLFDNIIKPAIPLVESWGQSIANIITLLTTGDFSGGIFGLQEDDDFITFLFDVRDAFVNLFQSFALFPDDIVGAISNFLYSIGQDDLGDGLIAITDWIQGLLDSVQPIIDALGAIWKAIQDNDPAAFKTAIDGLFSAFGTLWTDTISPALVTLWGEIYTWLTESATGFQDAVGTWWPQAQQFYDEWAKPSLDALFVKINTWIIDNAPTLSDYLVNSWGPAFTDLTKKVEPDIAKNWGDTFGTVAADLVNHAIPEFINTLTAAISGSLKAGAQDNIKDFIDGFEQGFFREQIRALTLMINFALGFVKAFTDNVNWDPIINSFEALNVSIGLVITNAIREQWGNLEEAGVYLMDGLRHGIWRGLGWIIDAATGVAQAAVNAFRNIWDMRSPSKVAAEELGVPFSQGIAKGIMDGADSVNAALATVIAPVMSPAQMSNAGSISNISNSQSYNLNVSSSQGSQGVMADFGIMQAMAL